MRRVYVDTGAFIALIWARDRAHARMSSAFGDLLAHRTRLFTSDPVVGETATRLRYDAGLASAVRFHDLVEQAVTVSQLEVVESGPDLRRAAFDVMATYDGRSLSYADAVGSAVATLVDADAVLGLDEDFRILGHRLLPE